MTGVQTCALPIWFSATALKSNLRSAAVRGSVSKASTQRKLFRMSPEANKTGRGDKRLCLAICARHRLKQFGPRIEPYTRACNPLVEVHTCGCWSCNDLKSHYESCSI